MNVRIQREPGGGHRNGSSPFSLFRNVRSKYIFLVRRKKCEPWTDVAFKSPAWFCPYCSMLFCDTQKYSNGDDATTVLVLFCRQSHLGCTDMSAAK